MRFTLAAAAAFVSLVAASSNGTEVYVTDVVTAYTTYCPYATQVTLGSSTYTVTEATTLTITDCPCTVTKPAHSTAAPPKVIPTGGSKPSGVAPSGVAPSGGVKPSGTKPSTPTGTLAPFKGAADKVSVGVAGVLAVAGLVAVL